MHKKMLTVIFVYFTVCKGFAQEYDSIPPYQKDSIMPAFSILQTDSTWFIYTSVPADKPVVITYFNPDCGHCHLTAHEFREKKDMFKDVFFVWVSYMSLPDIQSFAKEYRMVGSKNTCIGRDPNYFIPSYYRVKYTPFVAVYDQNRRLLQTYEGGADPETVYRLLYPAKN